MSLKTKFSPSNIIKPWSKIPLQASSPKLFENKYTNWTFLANVFKKKNFCLLNEKKGEKVEDVLFEIKFLYHFVFAIFYVDVRRVFWRFQTSADSDMKMLGYMKLTHGKILKEQKGTKLKWQSVEKPEFLTNVKSFRQILQVSYNMSTNMTVLKNKTEKNR